MTGRGRPPATRPVRKNIVQVYGPDHPFYLGGDEPSDRVVRFFRCSQAVACARVEVQQIREAGHEVDGSAVQDRLLIEQLLRLGGDTEDVVFLIGLGDAFTSERAAWQQWDDRPQAQVAA